MFPMARRNVQQRTHVCLAANDPQGKGKDCEDCTNNEILKVLLRLIGDEYRISGEYSEDKVNAFLLQWSLLDLSSNVSNENGYPRQENGKRQQS